MPFGAFRSNRPIVAFWAAITCALTGWIPLSAQIEVFPLEVMTTEQGLSHGTVWTTVLDQTGFLWVGSSSGLNRFDGYGFKVYRREVGEDSLPDNFIRVLLPAGQNQLWIGTSAGLALFDTLTGTCRRFRHNPVDPHHSHRDFISTLVQANDGGLWIGTDSGLSYFDTRELAFRDPLIADSHADLLRDTLVEARVRALWPRKDGTLFVGGDQGLVHYDPARGTGVRFPVRTEDTAGLSHPEVRALHATPDGHLWVGTSNGLDRLDAAGVITNFSARDTDRPLIRDNWINVLAGDEAGRLWVGTRSGGISLIQPKSRQAEFFSSDPNQGSLPSNNIVSLRLTPSGLLWIGTYKAGLLRLDLKNQKFRCFRVQQTKDQTKESVAAMYLDREDNLWLGNLDGLIRFNRGTGQISHYHHDPGNPRSLSTNSVLSIEGFADGTVWVGTYDGGLNRYRPETDDFTHFRARPGRLGSLPNGVVNALYTDPGGLLWIGTRTGLHTYDAQRNRIVDWPFPDGGIFSKETRISTIRPGPEGLLWVGTNGGFCKFVPSTGEFRRYRHDPNDPKSIKHDSVSAVLQDSEGQVWVGTNNGLARFDPWTEHFETVYQGGLNNLWINGIQEGRPGELWITTNAGLFRFTPPENVVVYDQLDGLQGKEFLPNSVFRAPSGELFIGGVKGYNSFFPREMLINPHIPNVAITSFRIFGLELPLTERLDTNGRLVIPASENFFSFEFSALDFTAPAKNRYAYMLEGFDEQWNYSSGRRYASYTNLNGGDYRFRVKASNNDGVWNEEGVVIGVRIMPPFWRRESFLLILGLMVLAFLVGGHQYRMRDIKRNQRNLTLTADRQTDAIRGAHQRLAEEVRKAGIAEMTTGVLHNIGNILTTVSTSAAELRAIIQRSKLEQFRAVNNMMADHKGNLSSYLQSDPKGRLIPEFLKKVERQFHRENESIDKETEMLLDKIALMAQAVSMEQSYVSSFDRKEQVHLTELIDNALSLQEPSLKKRNIEVIRKYQTQPPCNLETVKLVHVVTNLIKNAADALTARPPNAEGRRLEVQVTPLDAEFNMILIKDNGCGISPENQAKLFEFGFTTKADGHGFGLHSCRATMREMGGDIRAESEGQNRGTTFFLKVPIMSKSVSRKGHQSFPNHLSEN